MKKVVNITLGYTPIYSFSFHTYLMERLLLVGLKFHFREGTISQKTSLNSSNEHLDKTSTDYSFNKNIKCQNHINKY